MATGVHNEKISHEIDQLFSSILLEQQKFDSIRQADPHKRQIMDSLLSEYKLLRGRGFFHPYLSTGRGHGPFTELVDGSVKYDLIGSMGVGLLGHSHPLYIKSHLEAATNDMIVCGNLLVYQESLELSRLLLEKTKKSQLRHFWFAGSGSFAGDMALKIIWQKCSPRHRLIAFENAFAGRSVAMGEVTWNPAYREGLPRFLSVDRIPFYQGSQSIKNTLSALDSLWEKHKDEYAMCSMELVQGEAGCLHGPDEFYLAICEWAKERGLYIWIDEVQTFGRTRELFAYQMMGLDRYVDVVTVGKALQCCGVLFTEELNPRPSLIAGTFISSLASLKAGQKIIRYLTEGNFYGEKGRIHKLENQFKSNLQDLACHHPIKDIRGVGAMISFQVGQGNKEETSWICQKTFP